MTKGLVCVLLFATLFFLAHSARVSLTEDLQLQHAIDWYKSQTCGSPFLYDENFGGPGNVPVAFTLTAQTIADNLLAGGDNTNVANVVTAQTCSFHPFISDVLLSTTALNIHNAIVEITYSGPLVEIGRTLKTNAQFNRVRRCPAYDNYAFGLRIDNTTTPETIHFVILALASDASSLCTGAHTTLTTTSAYLCGSTCTNVEGTTGDVTYIPAPTEIAEGVTESDTDALIWQEANQNTFEDQTLDIYTLNSAGAVTFNTPQNNDIVSVTPNDGDVNATIVSGTHIVSWFLKYDPIGSTNPVSQEVSGSVIFSTPIIGAIFTQIKPRGSRTRLSESDPTFGSLCVTYNNNINDAGIFRGLEYSTLRKTAESFTIDGNVFTINNFEAKQRGVDNVRIFTTCPYGPACDVAVNATLNVVIIPPPAFITPGHLQSNTDVFLFRERRWLLSRTLIVDRIIPSYPDVYLIQAPTPVDPTLPAGLAVTSWYFHAETVGTVFTNYTAAATFKDKIIAYIFRAVNPPNNTGHETLKATDALFGDHCTSYDSNPGFNPQSFRGLEFTTADSLNVDASGYRLDFILRVTKGQDDFRVLTQCDT